MGQTLTGRGPHGGGEEVGEGFGLAHRLLRATPEAGRERQPVKLGACAIVADLRLDYREELLGALGHADPGFPGDAALVLLAYERWGDGCVHHLRGDFAFALWDGARRRLFCARDHFGARPFVYATTPTLFAFGSEAKAILEVPEVPRVLNQARVGDFLVDGYHEAFDATATLLRDVQRLPPAHTLTVERGQLVARRYWSLAAARGGTRLSPSDAVDGFRAHLAAAVRERLRGGAAVGVMVSGGLDSTSIAAFAAAARRDQDEPPLRTLSCAEEDGVLSRESDFVRLAARLPHVAPTVIRPRDMPPLAGALDDLFATIDDPFDMMEIHLLVYRAASRAGLTAVLDGCDGDLVASRNGALRFAVQSGRWRTAWREAGHQARWARSPLWRTLARLGVRPAVRGALTRAAAVEGARQAWGRHRRRYQPTADTCYIRRSFAERIGLDGRRQAAFDHFLPSSLFRATPDEEYAHWLESGLIGAALERLDRLAASPSVEPRHPFLDVKLVSFYLEIPWDSPANQGLPKAVLRRAAASHLPPAICERLFETPVHAAFRHRLVHLQSARITEIIGTKGIVDDFVDTNALRRVQTRGPVGDLERRALLRIALLAAWLERVRPRR